MKMDIKWHEECLENRLRSLSGLKKQVLGMEKSIEKQNIEINLYTAQIDLAKQEGKSGFDSERFAIKRLCI